MQVFKAFFKIAWKHIHSISIYFVIYLFITLALSLSAKDSMDANFQSKSLSLTILDEDQSVASHALTDYLDSLHDVSTKTADAESLADQMYYRTLDYILTIPAGFEENLLAGNTDALVSDVKIPGSTSGYFVDQQISQYLNTVRLYLTGGFSMEDAVLQTNESFGALSDVNVVSFTDDSKKTDTRIFYYYQYLPYIFILILFVGLAPILVTENRSGIRERTLCSSLPITRRNLALAAACGIYSILTWACFMLTGLIVYGTHVFQYYSLLGMLNSFVFLLFAAAVTLLVSLFAPNSNILNMLANILGLSIAFLCGVFVPQSMLPDQVLAVGRFMPAYWYVKANNLLSGFADAPFDSGTYLQCLGMQLLFTAAMFAVTLAVSLYQRKHS